MRQRACFFPLRLVKWLLPEQCQHVLAAGIGLRQRGDAGLCQDLVLGQIRDFLCHVGVANGGFSCLGVLGHVLEHGYGRLQPVHAGTEVGTSSGDACQGTLERCDGCRCTIRCSEGCARYVYAADAGGGNDREGDCNGTDGGRVTDEDIQRAIEARCGKQHHAVVVGLGRDAIDFVLDRGQLGIESGPADSVHGVGGRLFRQG